MFAQVTNEAKVYGRPASSGKEYTVTCRNKNTDKTMSTNDSLPMVSPIAVFSVTKFGNFMLVFNSDSVPQLS